MIEDLLLDIEHPLQAFRLITCDIMYKIDEDWSFFRKETRKEAQELKTYIYILQELSKMLTNIFTEYKNTLDK